MKTFEFTVTLTGTGDTEAEAWQDATDAFADDPGEPESAVELDGDDDDATCELSAERAIELAKKHAHKNSSAQFCLDDAEKQLAKGELLFAKQWALRSLAHSVGAFNLDYQEASK